MSSHDSKTRGSRFAMRPGHWALLLGAVVVALLPVLFGVRRGEAHALSGPNGSGKTTVPNLLSGLYVPTAGAIHFRQRDVVHWRPSRIAVAGMARSFQNLRLSEN